MNNKTVIIDNNSTSRNKLTNYMQLQMPNINLIAQTGNTNDGITLIKTQQPQLVFVNIQYLTAEHFMQLKEIKNSSLVFITSEFVEEQLNNISGNLFQKAKPKLQLKVDDHIHKIPFDDIIRIEANSNYALIFTTQQDKPILVAKSLKYLINKMDSPDFIRPHQSHFVNKKFITSYTTRKNAHLMLKDHTQVKIARRRLKSIKINLA